MRLVFFSAVKKLQCLPIKIAFKLNLREADVTFWWRTVLTHRALLLHMGPNLVIANHIISSPFGDIQDSVE